MKKSRFLTLALALALLMSVTTLPAAAEEPVTLTIGVQRSSVVENWDTNLQTLKIEEICGVNLEFVEFPSSNNECMQKVDLMVVAGGDELPDVLMFNLPTSVIAKYGKAGIFVDLTDLYDGVHDKNFTEQSTKSALGKEGILKYITSPDGRIYGMPYVVDAMDNEYANNRMLIYEPWLKALDLEMPTTIDEFVEVLRAFKTQDPNGNGEADEIPTLGNIANKQGNFIRPLMSPFIYTQDNYYQNVDGKIEYVANTEKWKEGLLFIRSLVDEELLSPLTFTMDFNQFKAIMTQDTVVVGVQGANSSSYMPADMERRIEYIIAAPLEGPDGTRQCTVKPQLPSTKMYITRNCQNVEKAFEVGDFLCSQLMSVWDRYGIEGVDWRYAVEGEHGAFEAAGIPTVFATLTSKWGTMQNTWWGHVGPQMLMNDFVMGVVCGPLDHFVPLGRSISPLMECANTENGVWGLIFTDEEQKIVDEYQNVLNDYVMESVGRFVTRDLSLEDDWDNYVASIDAMGLEEYLGAIQSAFDRTL